MDQVDELCRHVRGGYSPFGGIQLLLGGDFFQLPPVPDPFYGDSGEFSFNSPVFHYLHVFRLTEVKRQTDPTFIEAINQASQGVLNGPVSGYLETLSRPLPHAPNDLQVIHLYATNFEALCHNADCLTQLEGEWKIYHSQDEG